MSQVFDRNGTYYARFMHNGKGYLRSTGVTVVPRGKKGASDARKEAEAKLSRMLAEIKGRESADALFERLLDSIDRLPKQEQEAKRITLAGRLREGVDTKLPIADAWEAWLRNPKKRNPSQRTVDSYLAYWGREQVKKHGNPNQKNGFKNWLAGKHSEVTCLHEVNPAIAEEYAGHLWNSGISPRTYNGAIKFLRSMFNVLKVQAGLSKNPWDDIPSQAMETESRRDLTPEELKKVCSRAEGNLRYWFAIGLYAGLRLGDVITLKWSEIDLKKHVIERCPSKTRRKGKKIRIPLHPVLEAMLKELKKNSEHNATYLFPEDAELQQNGRGDAISSRIQKHFVSCGIETTEKASGHRKKAITRVGFHSLRHSFVSLCAANNVPQVAIQELVGHGSPAMTALYSHAGDKEKARAIAALPRMEFEK